MNIAEIVAALDAEIERLRTARGLLQGDGTFETGMEELPRTSQAVRRGPPAKTVHTFKGMKPKAIRRISPEGRARIAAAQKARWAAKSR